jgi:hypothetical protein
MRAGIAAVRIVKGMALVLLAAGCFEGPTAGEVTLALSTSNLGLGAVSFTARVAAPNEINGATAACAGCTVFYSRVSRTELRGIVTGDLVPGPLVRLAVLDAGPTRAYRVDVREVADRQFAVVTRGGYTLSILP